MIRWKRTQVQPIGLDIGFDSIKMLQLAAVGDTLEVVAAARHALPEEVRRNPELRLPAAVDLIRQMLRSNPFVGRGVVAALPRDIIHVKNLRLPMMPQSELAQAVEFEARNILHFDADTAHVRFLPAGEVRQGAEVRQEVVVLAARHNDVDNFLEHMHCCGAIVQSIDFEPCAIYRGVERFIRRKEDENEVHVLVDIGLRRSQVVIGTRSASSSPLILAVCISMKLCRASSESASRRRVRSAAGWERLATPPKRPSVILSDRQYLTRRGAPSKGLLAKSRCASATTR
jgi:Tfp pilus assembly PilM family ATPase